MKTKFRVWCSVRSGDVDEMRGNSAEVVWFQTRKFLQKISYLKLA